MVDVELGVEGAEEVVEDRALLMVWTLGRARSSGFTTTVGLLLKVLSSLVESLRRNEERFDT